MKIILFRIYIDFFFIGLDSSRCHFIAVANIFIPTLLSSSSIERRLRPFTPRTRVLFPAGAEDSRLHSLVGFFTGGGGIHRG